MCFSRGRLASPLTGEFPGGPLVAWGRQAHPSAEPQGLHGSWCQLPPPPFPPALLPVCGMMPLVGTVSPTQWGGPAVLAYSSGGGALSLTCSKAMLPSQCAPGVILPLCGTFLCPGQPAAEDEAFRRFHARGAPRGPGGIRAGLQSGLQPGWEGVCVLQG